MASTPAPIAPSKTSPLGTCFLSLDDSGAVCTPPPPDYRGGGYEHLRSDGSRTPFVSERPSLTDGRHERLHIASDRTPSTPSAPPA